jgi:hypothetical protein
MKRKVKARQSPAKAVKRETFDITVENPKLLELEKLINQRKRITRKIRNLPKLEKRLIIESPEVTLQQLFERLQKTKSAIDKAIAKHDGLSKSKRPPSPLPAVSALVMERVGPMSIEQALAKLHASVATPNPADFRPTCPTVNGSAVPYLTQVGTRLSAVEDLNHNSTANYYVGTSGYSMGRLVWDIAAWLNDDASRWRFDDPDAIGWYDGVCISMPRLECDSTVVASLGLGFGGHIRSEADDHNEIRQYVYVAHSDEDGNLPASVAFGDRYELNAIDLSGEIGLPEDPEGPIIGSGWVTATMSFNTNANATPKVAVATCTELRAQDGTLKIAGDWKISDLVYSMTPI